MFKDLNKQITLSERNCESSVSADLAEVELFVAPVCTRGAHGTDETMSLSQSPGRVASNMKDQGIAREGRLSCHVQTQEILRSPRACPDLIKCTKYRKVSTFNIQMTKNKHPLKGLKTH